MSDATAEASAAAVQVDLDALIAEARKFVGEEAVGEPLHGLDEVNVPMIRHFCQAVGDTNPVYLDDDAAKASRHGGPVCPPAMLGVWTMGTPRNAGGPRDRVMRALDQAGYTSVVATDYSHEYLVEVRPGDRIHERRSVEDLVGPKTTGLGEGWFATTRYDYYRQDGTLLGIGRMRLLKFRPRATGGSGGGSKRPKAQRPRPVINRDNQFFWDGVEVGELRIQRCADCARLRHPPGPMCPSCRSTNWDWTVASGRGTVFSYAIHHHPPLPGIDPPHTVLLIDLDEGVRFLSHATGMTHRDVSIGMPVELTFESVDDELTLPLFRPVDGALPEPPAPPTTVDDVQTGTVIPGFEIEMTPTFIISGALATRDFEEVHHDPAIAKARGSEDLFPNILTSNGLALRLVTDWLGPNAIIEKASIRLGLPAYVGETLRMTGEVVRVQPRPDRGDGEVEIAVRGRISTGDHLAGTVVASVPMDEVPA